VIDSSEQSFRRALEHRLAKRASETGLPIARLRRETVFEALLNRLQIAARGRWLLKGGLALDLRLGPRARTTKDMDLARNDTAQAATADFIAAQNLDVPDRFSFVITKSETPAQMAAVQSVRYTVRAEMAGRLFEKVVVDVGFGDARLDAVDTVTTSGLLAFAGIPPVQVPALPIAQHLAEKVHAFTRRYASGSSSRVKDLIDMVLIVSLGAIESRALRQAIEATFATRTDHDLPETLFSPDPQWAVAYARLAREVGLDEDIQLAFQAVARY
jgi:Nucleotidyl transferase AbiEii toxin, Type IV TA system